MKNTWKIMMASHAFCAGALFLTLPAFGQSTGFYLKGDIGGNFTPDVSLKEFFGPVAPGSKVKLDPGVRAGVAGGYQVTDWLAGEAELGVVENQIDTITGADVVHNSTLANVPLLFNVKLQWPNQSPWRPYIGAGAGFSETILNADYISLGGTSLHGSAADTVFAYQAFAGLRYQLNDRMGVAVEYRYFVAESPRWQSDFSFGGSDSVSFGRSQTHAFSLAFDFQF